MNTIRLNSKVKIIDTSCHNIPLGAEGIVVGSVGSALIIKSDEWRDTQLVFEIQVKVL